MTNAQSMALGISLGTQCAGALAPGNNAVTRLGLGGLTHELMIIQQGGQGRDFPYTGRADD
ncbi:hypothetical protein GCM10027565_28410 [Bordetella tumulicola]